MTFINKRDNRVEPYHFEFHQLMLAIFMLALALIAVQVRADDTQWIPLAHHEHLKFDAQSVQVNGLGLVVQADDDVFVAMLNHQNVRGLSNESVPANKNSLELVADIKTRRHQYLAVLKGEFEQFSKMELGDFQVGGAYGYQWLTQPQFSVVLGAGLFVAGHSAQGEESGLALMPIPLIRINHQSDWVAAQFEFLGSPSIAATLAPKQKLRIKLNANMDQIGSWDDLAHDVAIAYRPFAQTSAIDDFAELAVGFKRDAFATLDGKSGNEFSQRKLQYHAIYSELDLSLLKLTAGFAYEGQMRNADKTEAQLAEGFYFSVQGMYAF